MKKTAIVLLVFGFLFGFSNKTLAQSKVKGTLTYFFNKYQGNKPDTGAKIYVVDSSNAKGFDYKIYYAFNAASTYRHIYNNNLYIYTLSKPYTEKYKDKKKFKTFYDKYFLQMEESKKNMDEAYNELVKVGAETEEKFNELDKLNITNLHKITFLNEHTITTIADGAGNYDLQLDFGTYYVIIQSKGRTGLSISESQGLFYYENVILTKNKEVDVSYNFY